ncbi:MAG: hypothetical protein CSB34_02015 [Desulfobulbus propionicus]|nr:MAG: hypothetical protein CSB34_02015 [Desulfobulbus propionicus]PIE63666.1 MAG: hypothetical protein CSA26_11850 [Desulfobacterales bacterium]
MRKHAIVVTLIVAALTLCGSALAEYKPGTYKAAVQGKKSKKHSGLIEVEVTLAADKIEDIKVLTYEQSVDNKKYGPGVSQAKETIPAAIIANQSVNVDNVAKATFSSNALQLAVAKILHEATVAYKPGTYKGTAMGKDSKKHSGVVTVEVTVAENKIESINVLEFEQSVDHKKYGPVVTAAKEQIPAGIIAGNSLNVDAVADATMSSNALELAVARALEQAR